LSDFGRNQGTKTADPGDEKDAPLVKRMKLRRLSVEHTTLTCYRCPLISICAVHIVIGMNIFQQKIKIGTVARSRPVGRTGKSEMISGVQAAAEGLNEKFMTASLSPNAALRLLYVISV
jgi:hypothetical protein